MANDKRFIVKNGLRSQNVEFTDSQDGSNQITLNMLNTDTLNFEGDAGSLFSISDDLTGTVFSVGDISGIPIIEVNGDTHNVTFNEFDGKVMIGGTDSGSSDDDVLNVTGNVRATAYYGDGSNLTGIAASGGVDSAAVSSIITADVDKAFVDALNVDADTLDGVNSTSFLRSDAADAFSGKIDATGTIEFAGGTTFDPSGGGTGTDTATDVGIALTSGNRIVGTYNGYIRTLVEFEGNNLPLNIGQSNTAIINHTRIYGGSNGVELYENTTKRLETTTSGVTITGTATATTFSGSGASLTSLPAGQLTGTVSDARLPSSISSDITGNAATATILSTARNIDITGVTATAQSFDGSGDISIPITAVPASLLTGTISDARLPASISSDITGNATTATTLATARNIDITGVTATAQSFNGSGDISIPITAVPASLLTGTISDARLPASISSDITGNAATATTATSATDAGTLDGINSTSFLRSDSADTKTSGDLTFSDNVFAKFGDGSDLQIYHNGSNSLIRDVGSGSLYIDGSNIFIRQNTSELAIAIRQNAGVELYYDGAVKKLETTSTGATVTGTLIADGVTLGDNENLTLGTDNDMTIDHTGTAGVISNTTGFMYIKSSSGIIFQNESSVELARMTSGGEFRAYHNGNHVFRTISNGVQVQSSDNSGPFLILKSDDPADVSDFSTEGTIQFFAENDVSESVEYVNFEMVTRDVSDGTEDGRLELNIMDNGTITRSYIFDHDRLYITNAQQLHWLDYSSTFDYVLRPNTITADRTVTLPDASGEILLTDGDGSSLTSVDAETLDGVNSTSFLRSDSADTKTSGNLSFSDNVQLQFGTGTDLQIYHASSGPKNWIVSMTSEIEMLTIGGDLKFTTFGSNSTDFTGNVDFTAATVTGLATGSSTEVSLTAPSSPSEGDMWYDPEYGNLLIYYTDSDTSQWVTTNAPGVPDNSINSSKFSNAVSLVIYDSSGSAVKTLYSPDN